MNLQNLSAKTLASYIDHTLLKPETTKQQIRKLCEEALEYHFFAVCVNSGMVSAAREVLKTSKVHIASVIGFPHGTNDSATKAFETNRAVNLGASEIDMVINIGALKAGEFNFVERDIFDVVRAAEGKIVKVILETFLLTDEEKKKACEISVKAGAHFVKTCTGFNGGQATVADIELMKSAVQNVSAGTSIKIKASGGIRDFESAKNLIVAGASRLGTSSGVSLVKGLQIKGGY
jgi:deoxyribose-phosphate aldolase